MKCHLRIFKTHRKEKAKMNSQSKNLLRECIKAVCFLGVREGHSHAGGERRVEDHSSALKP